MYEFYWSSKLASNYVIGFKIPRNSLNSNIRKLVKNKNQINLKLTVVFTRLTILVMWPFINPACVTMNSARGVSFREPDPDGGRSVYLPSWVLIFLYHCLIASTAKWKKICLHIICNKNEFHKKIIILKNFNNLYFIKKINKHCPHSVHMFIC